MRNGRRRWEFLKNSTVWCTMLPFVDSSTFKSSQNEWRRTIHSFHWGPLLVDGILVVGTSMLLPNAERMPKTAYHYATIPSRHSKMLDNYTAVEITNSSLSFT